MNSGTQEVPLATTAAAAAVPDLRTRQLQLRQARSILSARLAGATAPLRKPRDSCSTAAAAVSADSDNAEELARPAKHPKTAAEDDAGDHRSNLHYSHAGGFL
jgi:hypothetical protein